MIVPGSTQAKVAPFLDQLIAVESAQNQRQFIGALAQSPQSSGDGAGGGRLELCRRQCLRLDHEPGGRIAAGKRAQRPVGNVDGVALASAELEHAPGGERRRKERVVVGSHVERLLEMSDRRGVADVGLGEAELEQRL